MTATPSNSDAAIKAYTEFTTTADQAAKVPDSQTKPLLAEYAEGKYLSTQLKAIQHLHSQGKEPWGQVVVHITGIKIKKDSATIEDCQDQSEAGVAYRVTHKLIRGTKGDRRVHLLTTLKRGDDGRWRLTHLVQLDTPCSPEPSSS